MLIGSGGVGVGDLEKEPVMHTKIESCMQSFFWKMIVREQNLALSLHPLSNVCCRYQENASLKI